MTGSSLRVGLGLLSVYPSSNAGTTTYVRGLLSGLAEDGVVEVTALANAEMARTCGDLADPTTVVRGSRRFATAERRFGRVGALGMSTLMPIVTAGDIQDVDVVHYPQTVRSPRVDRPAVVTLHDVQHLDLPDLFSPLVRVWRRFMYDESARRSDAVMTNSEHSRSRIIDRLAIDPARIHVSYQGVDSRSFTPKPASNDDEIRRGLGIDKPYLFYPASLAPHKNHSTLLRALHQMEGSRLVLVGPHANRLDDLIAEANRCGVGERISHLGMVAVDVLPALYRGASCLAFPSLYEGFGLPIVEAMASGCPVACSDRGAPAEIAGGAASLFDPEQPEAIVRAVEVLDDPIARGRLITDGLRRAKDFTWLSVAERHRRVYEQVAR